MWWMEDGVVWRVCGERVGGGGTVEVRTPWLGGIPPGSFEPAPPLPLCTHSRAHSCRCTQAKGLHRGPARKCSCDESNARVGRFGCWVGLASCRWSIDTGTSAAAAAGSLGARLLLLQSIYDYCGWTIFGRETSRFQTAPRHKREGPSLEHVSADSIIPAAVREGE